MPDRPILFSGPMILALLDGRKTQTRRVLKVPGIMGGRYPILPPEEAIELEPGEFARGIFHYASTGALSGPYQIGFAVGDRLWVRETWAKVGDEPDDIHACPDMRIPAYYRADMVDPERQRWRPSIFMPRWASRLTLTVTDVRVERLRDISEADAIREGVTLIEDSLEDPVAAFKALWESINTAPGKRWEDNPFVAALSFTVERRNIDGRAR